MSQQQKHPEWCQSVLSELLFDVLLLFDLPTLSRHKVLQLFVGAGYVHQVDLLLLPLQNNGGMAFMRPEGAGCVRLVSPPCSQYTRSGSAPASPLLPCTPCTWYPPADVLPLVAGDREEIQPGFECPAILPVSQVMALPDPVVGFRCPAE